MVQQAFETFVGRVRVHDDGSVREEVWEALTSCVQRPADQREEVLRELLDEAHARIRSLEASLGRLAAALISERATEAATLPPDLPG